MKKLIALLVVSIFLSFNLNAIGFDWYGLSNTSGNYKINDLIYHDNHIYGIGEFENTSIVVGGNTLSNSSSSGTKDLFVFKADTLGTVIWATKFGGAGEEYSNNMTVDNAGNALITGSFEGTGVFGTNSLISNGGKDVFVLKLNPNGSVQWARNVGGAADDVGNDICSDFANSVYSINTFKNAVTFSGLTANAATTYVGITKYDALGNESWFKYTIPYSNNQSDDRGVAIKYDKNDSSVMIMTSMKSENILMNDPYFYNPTIPFILFTTNNGLNMQASFKYNSTFIPDHLHSRSLSSLSNRPQDLLIKDSSQVVMSIDVPFDLGGASNSSLPYFQNGSQIGNTYSGYLVDWNGYHQSIPKISGQGINTFGIYKFTNANYCQSNTILQYSPFLNSGQIDTFEIYNDEIFSICNNDSNVYIGGKNFVGKICWTQSCNTPSAAPLPLTLTPAPDDSICPGNFTAIGLPVCEYVKGGNPPYTFSWTPNINMLSSNSARVLVNPANNTIYYLTVTDAANNVVYDTVSVFTTLINSISNLTISPMHDTICRGDTIQFSTNYNGTPSNYGWSSSFGSNRFNLINQTLTNTSSAGYSVLNSFSSTYNGIVSLTLYGTNGCYANAQSNITIKPSAVIGYTASTNGTLCQGDSLTLTGSGGVTSWSAGVQDSIPFIPNDTSIYIVTGVDTNGCVGMDTANISFHQVNHSIYGFAHSNPSSPNPPPPNQIPVNACLGDSVMLFSTGLSNISWTGGITNQIYFQPSSSGAYYVTGNYGNNCVLNDSVMVTLNQPNTLASSNLNQNPIELCIGDSVTLFGAGANTYTWTGGVVNNTSFIPTVSQQFIVTGTDTNNCSGTDSIQVIVNSLPTVLANSISNQNPIDVCAGDSITLYGSGANTYSWTGGIIDNVSFSTSNSQTFTVTGIDTNNCSATDSIQLIVNPLPNPIVLLTTSTLTTTNVSNIASYNWFLNGTLFGGNAVTQQISQNGQYVVEAIDSNGCSGFDTLDVINLSSSQYGKQNLITIYPNPTKGEFTISTLRVTVGRVEIYNLLGKKVSARKLDSTNTVFDMSSLAKGSYFVKVISNGQLYVEKIILE